MASRAQVISYTLRAFLILLIPIVLTAGQDNPNPQGLPPEEIVVWKVGSPHRGEMPDTAIPPDLEQVAQKMGFKLTVKPFSAVGFAQKFFDAYKMGKEPDVLAINNIGIIDGITTDLGDFAGIASDETLREKLVKVAESLAGLEGRNSYRRPSGWEYLIKGSEHFKAARLLALRPPECSQAWAAAPLSPDLQDSVIPIARAYLKGDRSSLAAWEDPERLRAEGKDPKQSSVLEIKGCGYWGDQHLAFVPVVSTYESAKDLGVSTMLLGLRKPQSKWQLLTASTDPVTLSDFLRRIPKLTELLADAGTPGEKPLPAKLLAPQDGQYPIPALGERFGDFVWQPNTSTDVVAHIIEFAYKDDARLFLRIYAGATPERDAVSDGKLWHTESLWRWRVWCISKSGAISFSEARWFSN